MKPKTVVLLAVAVGSGLLAMIGVQQAISSNAAHTPEEKVKVVVALEDIEIGMPLTETNVEFQEVAKSAIRFEDPVLTPEQFEKRSPLFALKAGDILRTSKLSAPGIGGKSQQIDKGMRVLGIPVDDTGSFSGLLSPGDRVDVMVTYPYRDNRGRQQTTTKTLLEYVEIFATDDKTAREASTSGDNKSKTRIVQLLLAPEHVPYVKLAESKGKLSLAWRRRDDDVLASVGPINEDLLNELRGLDAIGGRPGYETYAPPLFGVDGEGGEFPAPEFSGFGNTPDAAPKSDLDSMLTAAEGGVPAPQVAAVAPATPPKPMWKLHIYQGNEAIEHEFELPEVEVPEEELKELHDTVQGNQLWSLLKQAL